MSSLVLNRIFQQLKAPAKEKPILSPKQEVKKPSLPPVIPPDKLKEIFMSELNENPQVPENPIYMKFDGVECFVNWYLPLKDKFTEEQNTAMSTLVQARDMINVGCNCKRKNRLQQANGYFRTFWEKNSQTDLPKTILKVGNFRSISFAVDDHNFLDINSDTP